MSERLKPQPLRDHPVRDTEGEAVYQPALESRMDAVDVRSGSLLPRPGFLQPWPWWLVPAGCDDYIERSADAQERGSES